MCANEEKTQEEKRILFANCQHLIGYMAVHNLFPSSLLLSLHLSIPAFLPSSFFQFFSFFVKSRSHYIGPGWLRTLYADYANTSTLTPKI